MMEDLGSLRCMVLWYLCAGVMSQICEVHRRSLMRFNVFFELDFARICSY